MRKKTIKKVVKKKVARKAKEQFSGELKNEEYQIPVNSLAIHNALIEEMDRMRIQLWRQSFAREYVIKCECGRILKITV